MAPLLENGSETWRLLTEPDYSATNSSASGSQWTMLLRSGAAAAAAEGPPVVTIWAMCDCGWTGSQTCAEFPAAGE